MLLRYPKYLVFIFLPGVLVNCVVPIRSFEKSHKPKAPDYSNEKHWSALPNRVDKADLTIPNTNVIDKQDEARADVFFIHPTTYRTGPTWNANLKNPVVNKRTNKLPILYQASAFNGSCRVYAPRYRQAALITYIEKKGNGPKVFDLAYQDIKKAFLYYLENYNSGRPFIIASHSQGTDHAIRLVNEYIKKDSALYQRFIVAYLVGRPVGSKSIKTIQPCDSATQCRCFNAWNAVPWGGKTLFRAKPDSGLVCTNPLTWTRDTSYTEAKLNKGGLPLKYKLIDEAIADAKITETGLLWVHRPKNRTNRDYLYIESESFHNIEYNLFYMNIRENVKQRIESYFTTSGK